MSPLSDLAIVQDVLVAIARVAELLDAAGFKHEITPREHLASILFPKDVALTPRAARVKLFWEVCSALHSYYFEGRIGAFEQRLGESASEAPSDPDLLGDLAGLQAPPRKAEDTPSLPGSKPKDVSVEGKPARVAAALGAAEEPVVEPIAGSDARLEPEVTCHACRRAGHRV